MRLVRVVGAAVLISALAVPLYGERARRVDERGGGQQKQAERQKPDKGQKHAKKKAEHDRGREHQRAERVEHNRPAPRHVERREPAVVRHAYERDRHEVRREHRVVWQERRARHWAHEHRGWYQRGGYHGYRVPHERYRVWFGPAHRFRVHALPVLVVAGHPRFHYHGYWVTMVDPWPEYWAVNWYETDDVYVAYVNDGYYLYNVRHPGVAVAVNISF